MKHTSRLKLIPLALCLLLIAGCEDKPVTRAGPVVDLKAPEAPVSPVLPAPPVVEAPPGKVEPVEDKPLPGPPSAAAVNAALANNKLAWAMWEELGGVDDKNIFYSPTSVSQALSMVAMGTQGATSGEIWKVLGFAPESLSVAAQEQNALRLALGEVQSGKVRFLCANALWASIADPLRPEFVKQAQELFGAGLENLDFVQKEKSAGVINQWAMDNTNKKIDKVIKPESLDKETRLVLTNAVYFKADWEHQFKKERTRKAPFKLYDGSSQQVDMMNGEIGARFAEDDDFTMVELDYLQGRMVFRGIISNGYKDARKEAVKLDAQRVESLKKKLLITEVHVGLPKFTMEWEKELTPMLKKLGVRQALEDGDFSPMFEKTMEKTFISKVVQKTFVRVDEEGTEAAAVTAVSIVGVTSVKRVPTFYANRPFVFQLVEPRTDTVVFMGRVSSPKDIK